MDKTGSKPPVRIGVLPLPGFALMSYACTVEPLRAANLLSSTPKYEILDFGQDDWTTSSGSAAILNSRKIGEQPQVDLLLVIAGGNPFEFRDEAIDLPEHPLGALHSTVELLHGELHARARLDERRSPAQQLPELGFLGRTRLYGPQI